VRGRDCFSNADDAKLESWDGERGQLDELVGRVECIQDGGQAEIEDAVESENVNAHGKYDTKYDVLAYTTKRPRCLTWTQMPRLLNYVPREDNQR
jgi:hypothetical protein